MSTTTDLATRVAELRTTPMFADVPEQHLLKLAAAATPLHLKPGEVAPARGRRSRGDVRRRQRGAGDHQAFGQCGDSPHPGGAGLHPGGDGRLRTRAAEGIGPCRDRGRRAAPAHRCRPGAPVRRARVHHRPHADGDQPARRGWKRRSASATSSPAWAPWPRASPTSSTTRPPPFAARPRAWPRRTPPGSRPRRGSRPSPLSWRRWSAPSRLTRANRSTPWTDPTEPMPSLPSCARPACRSRPAPTTRPGC